MSGEGILPNNGGITLVLTAPVVGISAGVGLVLHFLRERAAVARRLADKDKGNPDPILCDRARQLEVMIADIEGGLHMPEMFVAQARAAVVMEEIEDLQAMLHGAGHPGPLVFGSEEEVEPGATDVDWLDSRLRGNDEVGVSA
ncbi:MAG: hypothetical protein Q8R81_09545 [Novosphingobium sp.]|uniref:hypothetical protein n=1 Tax=Novosphingobium sp. TaxID=1874826 RepID=UPI002735496A|nr:hypothetical protein [Novosphingobium sp.]MDP3550628.1 hypothetical protein [Novosphingobium sp.]